MDAVELTIRGDVCRPVQATVATLEPNSTPQTIGTYLRQPLTWPVAVVWCGVVWCGVVCVYAPCVCARVVFLCICICVARATSNNYVGRQ